MQKMDPANFYQIEKLSAKKLTTKAVINLRK